MKNVEHTHRMNKMLNECLYLFAIHGGKGKPADFLDHVRTCNFHKLRYWRFIQKIGNNEWAITPDGYDFLDGKTSVPEKAITFEGKVVRHEGLPVSRFHLPVAIWRRNDYAMNAKKITDDQPTLFGGAS